MKNKKNKNIIRNWKWNNKGWKEKKFFKLVDSWLWDNILTLSSRNNFLATHNIQSDHYYIIDQEIPFKP